MPARSPVSDRTTWIRKVDYFSEVDARIARDLADHLARRGYAAGELILRKGRPAPGLFFIESGEVALRGIDSGVRKSGAHLKTEAVFGELSVIDSRPCMFSVVAVKETRCLVLTHAACVKLMNRHPQLSVLLAVEIARRSPDWSVPVSAEPSNAELDPNPDGARRREARNPPDSSDAWDRRAAFEEMPFKERTKVLLVEAFQRFYVLKALTRFSVGLLGCPVGVESSTLRVLASPAHKGKRRPRARRSPVMAAEGVHCVLVPPKRAAEIHLRAIGSGPVSISVIRAASPRVMHFQWTVALGQRLRLCISADGAELEACGEGEWDEGMGG